MHVNRFSKVNVQLITKHIFMNPIKENLGIFISLNFSLTRNKYIRERSHMTSAAEGGGGFEMLTVADKGGRGSKPC